MLRRLFALACAFAALRNVQAQPCRGIACAALSPASLAHARRDFNAIAAAARRLDLHSRIEFVNAAINRRVDFASDNLSLGSTDLWLTPLETLALGRGDCEDFAITKFFALLAGGMDPGEVRLLYALRQGADSRDPATPHVVALAQHPYLDPLVLDNIDPQLRPVSCRADIDPVFSFDRAHLWAGVRGPDQGDARRRLRPWRETLERCNEQRNAGGRAGDNPVMGPALSSV